LIETKRPFAKWELAEKVMIPDCKFIAPSHEETVAETTDKNGNIIGRWVVKWGENGEGTCHEVGSIVRYVCKWTSRFSWSDSRKNVSHFNVHEEMLH
jgi:hypothetical protein